MSDPMYEYPASAMITYIDVVFDNHPGPEPGKFVEVENEQQVSISFGTWIERDDGHWVLRISLCSDCANVVYRSN